VPVSAKGRVEQNSQKGFSIILITIMIQKVNWVVEGGGMRFTVPGEAGYCVTKKKLHFLWQHIFQQTL
jgi:hypothetical protein